MKQASPHSSGHTSSKLPIPSEWKDQSIRIRRHRLRPPAIGSQTALDTTLFAPNHVAAQVKSDSRSRGRAMFCLASHGKTDKPPQGPVRHPPSNPRNSPWMVHLPAVLCVEQSMEGKEMALFCFCCCHSCTADDGNRPFSFHVSLSRENHDLR